MDRALNLDLLRMALGQEPGLPTPQEFRDLVSEVEVRLFAGLDAPDNDLIQLAWFLHSVASTNRALDLYSAERQDAAFRVAGHVFDVCLRSRELDFMNRLRLTLAGQTAYFRSGQNPNSIALGRTVVLPEMDLASSPGQASLGIGISLMMFDRERVFELSRTGQQQAQSLTETLQTDSLTETIYGPGSHVVLACRDLMKYLSFPDATASLRTARSLLRTVLERAEPVRDSDSQWVAAQLLALVDGLGNSSVWAAIPPGSSPAAARAMTTSAPPVLNLWPPQQRLFQEENHPLDPSTKRVLLSLPTSAGKSLISQLIVLSHLADGTGGVCFVAPTRSLVREIKTSLRRRMSALPFEMGLDTGTWEPPLAWRDVEVMTPERLTHMVRTDLTAALDEFGMFVIDEAHLLDDSERGWGLESTLTLLNNATLETHHRILLLSSAVGNRTEIMTWIDPRSAGLRFHDEWRGPRRLHGVYTTNIDWNSRQESPATGRQRFARARYPMHGTVRIKTSEGRIASGQFSNPVGTATRLIEQNGRERQGLHREESTNSRGKVIPLILHLAQGGPTLVVESTKRRAADLAIEAAERIGENEQQASLLAQECANRLVEGHPLIATLRKGVAYHHAALPVDMQGMIEDAVRDGVIRILVTTTTLTEGVNLPVRSVVLASQGGEWDDDPYIVGAKLYNAIGRAGRATKETAGWVVLVRHEDFRPSMFDLLERRDEELEITSPLAKGQVLDVLAEVDAAIRADDDAIFEIANSVPADFASYIWYLSRLVEDLDGAPHFERVLEIVERTLAWSQLEDAGKESWRRLSLAAFEKYRETPQDVRRKWAAATVSLGSAKRLEELSDELVDRIANDNSNLDLGDPLVTLEVIVEAGILHQLLELPEASEVHHKIPRPWPTAPATSAINIDEEALTRDWVSGVAIDELAIRHCSAIENDAHRAEATVEYVTALFENYLPWMLSYLIPWTNERLQQIDPSVEVCPDFGLHVQWGVPTAIALEIMRGGVSSRRVVNSITEQAEQESISVEEIQPWLGRTGVEELVDIFELNRAELREVLSFARIENRALRDLVSDEVWKIAISAPQVPTGRIGVILEEDDRGFGFVARDSMSHEVIAHVPTSAIEDVREVLATGLPLEAAIVVEEDSFLASESRTLEIRLLLP